ncbi:MAG: flagellar biosynthetic protein FliQ [Kofleriaceae bacterium]|nr:flagellar biosynthetic protein FliQ [Kofleriaceae bacterium]MCB9574677.1 flagellar biosynthetic protein FliQ [Kofleriaceae bacterium]
MTWTEALIGVLREGVLLALALAAPALAGALLAGIVTGVLGAVTQVQDASVAMAIRVVAVAGALAVAAPFIARQLGAFASHVLAMIPSLGSMS